MYSTYLETSSLLLLDGSYIQDFRDFRGIPEILTISPMLQGRGWGQSAQQGFSGEKPPKLGDGDGERLSKSFGETLGTGTITISGSFGGEIPKNLRISGWGQR